MDELNLYDQTRRELRRRLQGRFPPAFDLEGTLTANAYWVCTAVRNHGADWETTLQEYVELAARDAPLERQAEQAEAACLRRALAGAAGLLLDVGAGWGRFADLYAQAGLQAVYTEPSWLGCRLMQRQGLVDFVRCPGQSLCFPGGAFGCAVIGWVLHHDAPDVPAAAILAETRRVLAAGGRLISIEPLRQAAGRAQPSVFDTEKWRALAEEAGFRVENLETFFTLSLPGEEAEQHACLTAVK